MKRVVGFGLLVLSIVSASGCVQKVDIESARTAIRTADSEWSKTTGPNDIDAFMNFVASDCTILPPNEPKLTGANAIRQWYSAMSAAPGFSVHWTAASAEVAAAGDLGYTVGTYEFSMQGPDGSPMNDHGKYVTIWKKEPSGKWTCVIDMFNSDVPMMSMAPADTMGATGAMKK